MAFAENEKLGQWAFLLLLPDHARSQYPVVIENGTLYISPADCPISTLEVASNIIGAPNDDSQAEDKRVVIAAGACTPCALSILQANPCTLRVLTRRGHYFKQLKHDCIHICCCQEVRKNWSGLHVETGIL